MEVTVYFVDRVQTGDMIITNLTYGEVKRIKDEKKKIEAPEEGSYICM